MPVLQGGGRPGGAPADEADRLFGPLDEEGVHGVLHDARDGTVVLAGGEDEAVEAGDLLGPGGQLGLFVGPLVHARRGGGGELAQLLGGEVNDLEGGVDTGSSEGLLRPVGDLDGVAAFADGAGEDADAGSACHDNQLYPQIS